MKADEERMLSGLHQRLDLSEAIAARAQPGQTGSPQDESADGTLFTRSFGPATILQILRAHREIISFYQDTHAIVDQIGSRIERGENISAWMAGEAAFTRREASVLAEVVRILAAVHCARPDCTDPNRTTP